jgi:hypothetical protein
MDKLKALQIIKEACAGVQANLQTHTLIQQAIQVIEKELQPKEEKNDEVKKKKE